jgi:hypothetical protein
MKKDILYLVEKGAKETPADIMGLIRAGSTGTIPRLTSPD